MSLQHASDPNRRTQVRQAGPEHQVVTITTKSSAYRRKPCSDCPWRVDSVGKFPAEAFRHSARTAHDMSGHVFACHQSGVRRSATCAGFLLRGAQHSLAIRLRILRGDLDPSAISDGGVALHATYRAMAVANGVDPQDPSLQECR